MSDGYLFVLHASADETYAVALAAELGGLPMAQGAAAVQFGANIACVQIWSGHGDVSNIPTNTIVCRLNGAALPGALRGLPVADAQGDAAIDAAMLRAPIAALQTELSEKSARARGAAPRLGAAAAPQETRKPSLAARSVYGMAATFAIAGVIGPAIMERAQATGTTSLPPPTAAAVAQPVTAEPATAAVVIPVSSTPALDHALTQDRTHHATAPRVVPAEPVLLVADVVAPAAVPVTDMLLTPVVDAPALDTIAPMVAVPKLAAVTSTSAASIALKDGAQDNVSLGAKDDALTLIHRTVLP